MLGLLDHPARGVDYHAGHLAYFAVDEYERAALREVGDLLVGQP
jgi:hypothetical protein